MSVTIRAVMQRATDRAVLIDLDGDLHWLPKSQIETINGQRANSAGGYAHVTNDVLYEFVISDWIAQQKSFVLNEEKYTADILNGFCPQVQWAIKVGEEIIGWAPTAQKAQMIAAALNLTEGKR